VKTVYESRVFSHGYDQSEKFQQHFSEVA